MSADAFNPEPAAPEPVAPEPVAPEPTAPDGVAPEPEDQEVPRKRGLFAQLGKKRLGIIVVFALLLAGSLAIWITYLTTRQPIQKILPPAQAVLAGTLQPHYLFSINDVSEPLGVAVTPGGDRIYVVESAGLRRILAFDRDGKQLAAFAAPDSDPTTRLPVYVAVDNSGLVYVVDRLRSSIDVYDAGGNYQRSIKSPLPDSQAWFPLGIQADGDTLLVTEVTKGQHRVLRLSKDGQLLEQFGSEGQDVGQFEWPQATATDAKGRIYVSDGNNARVQAFDKSGKFLYSIAGFSLPRGVEIDGFQRLHVVDAIGQQVSVFDVSGNEAKPLFTFGDIGAGDGQFAYPNCVAIDDNDRLYITDRVNNRVQVWVY